MSFICAFDIVIHGETKFKLMRDPVDNKYCRKPISLNDQVKCGAQDLNSRTKIMLDDSFFVVATQSHTDARQILCLEPRIEPTSPENICVATRRQKPLYSVKLGNETVLVHKPLSKPKTIIDAKRNTRLNYYI